MLKTLGSDDQPLMVGLACDQPNGDFCVRVKTDLLNAGRELGKQLAITSLRPEDLSLDIDYTGVLVIGQGKAASSSDYKTLADCARQKNLPFISLGTGFYAALEAFAENVLHIKSDLFLEPQLFRTAQNPVFNVAYQGPFIEHGWQIMLDSEAEHLPLYLVYTAARCYHAFYDLPSSEPPYFSQNSSKEIDDQTELAKFQSLWHDCLIDFVKAMAETVTD
ncbi:MAG: hypothetical protein Q4E09_03585 [Eubacteriales bacterium]|nr:hypothetical protein [Eubacteriales bacterium]